jgi:hypothetical protein
MFRLDMDAIRRSADASWLTANLANPANACVDAANESFPGPELNQQAQELATLAGLAISQNTSQQSAEFLAARLIAAAMRACDHHGDGDEAREQMRADCLSTPPRLRADLLAHLTTAYSKANE